MQQRGSERANERRIERCSAPPLDNALNALPTTTPSSSSSSSSSSPRRGHTSLTLAAMHKPPRVYVPVERPPPDSPSSSSSSTTATSTPTKRSLATSPPSPASATSPTFSAAMSATSPSKRSSLTQDEIRSAGARSAGRPRARTLERRMRVSYGLVPSDTDANDAHCFAVNKIVALESREQPSLLFTASRDSSIRVWEVDAPPQDRTRGAAPPSVRSVARLQDHADWVNDIVLLADGAHCT